jgi:hypothetical protein
MFKILLLFAILLLSLPLNMVSMSSIFSDKPVKAIVSSILDDGIDDRVDVLEYIKSNPQVYTRVFSRLADKWLRDGIHLDVLCSLLEYDINENKYEEAETPESDKENPKPKSRDIYVTQGDVVGSKFSVINKWMEEQNKINPGYYLLHQNDVIHFIVGFLDYQSSQGKHMVNLYLDNKKLPSYIEYVQDDTVQYRYTDKKTNIFVKHIEYINKYNNIGSIDIYADKL